MARRVSACMVALICVALLAPVMAQATGGTTYNLEPLGMSIDIPDDYDVLTRDTPADDPVYARYGFTKDGFDNLMKEQNIYLNALLSDASGEIVVTMIDSPLQSFNAFSDSTLSVLISTIKGGYEEMGITYLKSEIYQHQQVKFVKIYHSMENGGQPIAGLQYYTVCNAQAINITLHSFKEELTQADEDAMQKIVDSADFRNAEPFPDTAASTESFAYVDSATGVSFTVPANWKEEAFFKEREFISAKFASTKEEGLLIIYGCADMWEQLPQSEKVGHSRSEIDEVIFSSLVDPTELAKSYGIEDGKVSRAKYGGKNYYMTEGTFSGQADGVTVSIPMTLALGVGNGYLCYFQFFGTSSSPYFQDFTQLLSSVRYPATDLGQGTDLIGYSDYSGYSGYSGYSADRSDPLDASFATNLFVSLIVTIAIYSLPIIIYRYGVVKRPVEHKKALRIVILYGIAAFLLMAVIIFAINGEGAPGAAIFLWSWVNYRVLTGGKTTAPDLPAQEEAPDQEPLWGNDLPGSLDPAAPDASSGESDTGETDTLEVPADMDPGEGENDDRPILYCRKCGEKLMPGSAFCRCCGTAVEKER